MKFVLATVLVLTFVSLSYQHPFGTCKKVFHFFGSLKKFYFFRKVFGRPAAGLDNLLDSISRTVEIIPNVGATLLNGAGSIVNSASDVIGGGASGIASGMKGASNVASSAAGNAVGNAAVVVAAVPKVV